MNILVFNWQDLKNPEAGGAEVHFEEIFSRIAALGHNVTLYCSSFPGASGEEHRRGIRIIREGGRYLFNYRVVWKYLTQFRHENYHVVIDDMNKIPFFTPLYVRKPLAFIIHHLFGKSIFLEAPYPLALYVHWLENAAVRLLRKMRTKVFVVSESTKREVLEAGLHEEQLWLAPNCVDHATHFPAVPERRSATPLIGYFGRLKRYKSVDHLLHAFSVIRHQMPEARLLIVGEGDDRPRLEKIADELGLHESVTFTGFVSEEEKVRYLQQVWFLVNTSSKEGWGLTVIEANACRTPVIGANVPGLRDAIRHNETGLLYRYGDVNEIAEKIQLLLNDSSLRERLRSGAFEWAKLFDWDTVAEQVIKHLTTLVGKSRSSVTTL